MPVLWDQEDLQPLRNTSMAEKLSGRWPMAGCHIEPPTQVLKWLTGLAQAQYMGNSVVGHVLGEGFC